MSRILSWQILLIEKNLTSTVEIKINLHISLLLETCLQNMKHCSVSKSESFSLFLLSETRVEIIQLAEIPGCTMALPSTNTFIIDNCWVGGMELQ